MVETPREFARNLLRTMPIEGASIGCAASRLVDGGALSGLLSALLSQVKPLGSAKYVVFETASCRG